MKKFSQEKGFTPYPCKDWLEEGYLLVNDREILVLEISNHVWKKSGREKITPELIQKIVKKLDNRDDKENRFIPEGEKDGWEYFRIEPLRDSLGKTYKLIWCWPKEKSSFLRIRTCHRTKKKYDKKN